MLKLLRGMKFTCLLSALLSLNAIRMMTVDDSSDGFIIHVLGAVLLTTAMLSLCVDTWSRRVALCLGVPAIGFSLARCFFPPHVEGWVTMASTASILIFLVFIIVVILQILMTQSVATWDSIAGAFCGYVLIGIVFAEAYCLLDILAPDSYRMGTVSTEQLDDPTQRFMMLEYFSFTTLTTLGFGDVIPSTPVSRGLAIWEVVCGQFYLAVLVAGLVNLRGGQAATVPTLVEEGTAD